MESELLINTLPGSVLISLNVSSLRFIVVFASLIQGSIPINDESTKPKGSISSKGLKFERINFSGKPIILPFLLS